MRIPLLALGVLAMVSLPGAADARTTAILPYPPGEVWATSVRFVRVDRGYDVMEKDAESGYILFTMVESRRSYKGSLELVPTSDPEGRDATRAVFTLPDLPRHFELMLLDKLIAKIKDERGAPAPPPPPRKPGDKEKRKDKDEDRDRATPDAGPPPGSGLPRAPTRELR